jgi:hypothetical protein
LVARRHFVNHPPINGVAVFVDAANSRVGTKVALTFFGADGSMVTSTARLHMTSGAFVDADVTAGDRFARANFTTLVLINKNRDSGNPAEKRTKSEQNKQHPSHAEQNLWVESSL